MTAAAGGTLPLFPLRTVLFPGGRLSLKVFEARYLDLVSSCLRERQPFGVVCLLQGGEVRQAGAATRFEPVGVLAHLAEVDAIGPGMLKVRCEGGARFQWSAVHEDADGLWQATGVSTLPADPAQAPGERFAGAVHALQRAYAALAHRPEADLPTERHFDDAGWVANRWCELLPVPLAARQQLMALPDPLQRLTLVDEFLRGKQLI
ncbi:LON peptidase substrate-binding domain-containing protein [Ideonella sp.]|uniref:LON peptidase substrate-binding domain-containing protein n=1 Tax=Ideonella sp. TaxID=1929293 RepID=UPI002B460664|nr:LON peptidase substrate-binding domain-containing protein [Ideonella sp.]HJV69564.1 LON peptidase substrate-binding domain-containing protein [Ideonella sp.]